MKILVVEDDPVYGPALVRSLDRSGYSGVLVDTVEGALQSELPSLAVVDLNLPDGSGVDVVRELAGRGARVIVLTGHGSIPAAVECMQVGAADFLTKPVSTAELCKALERVMSVETAPEAISERLDDVEREHILSVLHDCNGNISEAARRLGLYRRTLQRKLQKI